MLFRRTRKVLGFNPDLIIPVASFLSLQFFIGALIGGIVGVTIGILLPKIIETYISFGSEKTFLEFRKDWVELPMTAHLSILTICGIFFWKNKSNN